MQEIRVYKINRERGAALILTFIIFISLSAIAFAFLTMINYEIRSVGTALRNMQTFYIAEAGRAKAKWALTTGGESIGWGETDVSFGGGTYTVATVDNGDNTSTITSDGYIPDDTNPIAQRRVIEKSIPATSGPNLSLAATAFASSNSNTAYKSNDEDPISKWKSSVKNGSQLKHDFRSSVTFDRIVYIGAKIVSYTIMYSNDDAIYSAVTNPVESPAGTVTFDAVSARYLRFDLNGNRPEVNELETYNTDAGGIGQGTFVTSW